MGIILTLRNQKALSINISSEYRVPSIRILNLDIVHQFLQFGSYLFLISVETNDYTDLNKHTNLETPSAEIFDFSISACLPV